MSENWYQHYRPEKGQIDVKNSGRELILRRGIMMVRDSGCVRLINNTKQWFTYDRGTVVNEGLPGGGFQKINKYKVSPGMETRLCAPYGIAAQDHALYNLEFHDKDPIPSWSGGQAKFFNDLASFGETLGQTGRLVLGVGVVAIIGMAAVLVVRGASKLTPAGAVAGAIAPKAMNAPDDDDYDDDYEEEDA